MDALLGLYHAVEQTTIRSLLTAASGVLGNVLRDAALLTEALREAVQEQQLWLVDGLKVAVGLLGVLPDEAFAAYASVEAELFACWLARPDDPSHVRERRPRRGEVDVVDRAVARLESGFGPTLVR